jgi:hypothetical protein
MVCGALSFVDLAFDLKAGVTGQTANGSLNGTLRLICRAFDMFFIHENRSSCA